MADSPVDEKAPALDAEQLRILNEQLHGVVTDDKQARSILSFATSLDYIIIAISCLAAIIAGGLNPLLTVLYGQLVGSFDGFQKGTLSGEELRHDISRFTLYFVYLAIASFAAVYVTTVGFYYSGERITQNLRRAYLRTIIGQNIAFFDTLGTGELSTRLTSDITLIQEAITGNLSVSLTAAATFVSAFVIAFIEYWKLALILTSTVVVLLVTGTACTTHSVKFTKETLGYYSKSASIAEEAISAVKHVTAFGIQDEVAQRYVAHLKAAERPGLKAGAATAMMYSVINAIPYFSYALSFWEGSRLLVQGEMSISGVTTTTLAIVIGAWSIGRVAPNAKGLIASMASASVLFDAIARKSPQDPFSDEGERPECVEADIAFRGVQLVYPSRQEVEVLKGLDLVFPAHKTTAIVGASGCGKSSIIGLIERFYAPTRGSICELCILGQNRCFRHANLYAVLGEHNVQSLNLNWLRSQISLVSQEPTLFNTTIFENIVFGLTADATSMPEADLEKLVVAAALTANAHNFISDLPQGYQTIVGERGTQLSGGQRQRICIARAIIKNPQILLLDEATSALDVQAEREVQRALAEAAKGRTTIVIAHRLSTIRDADNIVVMADGDIVEQGTHEELIAANGTYAELVDKQRIQAKEEASSAFAVIDRASTDSDVLDEKDKETRVFLTSLDSTLR